MASGTIVSRYDPERRLILILARGVWSPELVDCAFAEAEVVVETMRSTMGKVRALVDRRGTEIQTAATVERLHMQTERLFRPEDRIAVVVDTSLAKLQARQSLDERTHQVFASERAAMMWLTAHD